MIHSNRRSLSLIALSPLALALAMASAQAATRTDLHDQNVSLLNSQYKLAAASGMPAKARDRHAEMLGLDAESALVELTTAEDKDGTRHYRYQQTFRGVPVWGEQVIVSEDAHGNVRNLFGRKVDGLASELPANASLVGKARAASAAKSASLGNRAAAMRVEREEIRAGDLRRRRRARPHGVRGQLLRRHRRRAARRPGRS